MFYKNRAEIMGNLTADAELVELPSGSKVMKFSVAVNWSSKEKEGVDYFNVEMFGNVEGIAPYMTRGKQVSVEARLKTDKWEAEDGSPRSMLKIQAYSIELGSSPQGKRGPAAESDA